MNFLHFLYCISPAFVLSFCATLLGSVWIRHLYQSARDKEILSFPETIAIRSRYRKFLLFTLLLLCYGKAWNNTEPSFLLFYVILAITILSYVMITDFEQYVIFDAMVLPLAAAGLCYTLHFHLPLAEHLAAALGSGLLFFLLTVLTKGAIGGGDIKLVAAMGLWFGYRYQLLVIMYGLLAGGAAALLMLLAKQKQRRSYFAYGPYFALTGIGILLGLIPFS